MSIKSLFFTDEESSETPKKVEQKSDSSLKFPSSNPSAPTESSTNFLSSPKAYEPQNVPVQNEHLKTFTEMYEKGFENLNIAGYDFFEFYQAVSHGDINNPATFNMAYAMANGMDKTITKASLTSQAEFYFNEILKVYNELVGNANNKKQKLSLEREAQTQSLTTEISALQNQIASLTTQLNEKQGKLNNIGSIYQPQLMEIDAKMVANDMAKNNILSNIDKVKNGIINNVK